MLDAVKRNGCASVSTWIQRGGGRQEQSQSDYQVLVRVAPGFIPALPAFFGQSIRVRVAQAEPPDAEGRITLELAFASLEEARNRLLDFGRGVEVLRPLALRKSILDFATQIVSLYTR